MEDFADFIDAIDAFILELEDMEPIHVEEMIEVFGQVFVPIDEPTDS